jgi:hypothetical protein
MRDIDEYKAVLGDEAIDLMTRLHEEVVALKGKVFELENRLDQVSAVAGSTRGALYTLQNAVYDVCPGVQMKVRGF